MDRVVIQESRIFTQMEPRGPSQLIEIPVPAAANGSGRVNIPDIPLLRNAGNRMIVIKGMYLITPPVLTNGILNPGVNAPLTELQKIALTLYSDQWEKGQSIPILTMNNTFTEGSGVPWNPTPFKLDDWRDVDWNKSYLQYGNGQVVAGAPYIVMFDVLYQKVNEYNQAVVGPGF